MRALHQRVRSSSARTSKTRKNWAACSRAGIPKERSTSPTPGCTKTSRIAMRRSRRPTRRSAGGHGQRGGEAGYANNHESDPTLQHPRCVFQILKKHFSRYTPEMVEAALRRPEDVFLKIAEAFVERLGTGEDGRNLLCGGLDAALERARRSFARRRFCNCCWATSDAPAAAFSRCADTLRFRAPPTFRRCTTFSRATCRCRTSRTTTNTCDNYSRSTRARPGVWANFDKYIVSLMRAYYGDAISKEKNNWGFDWLPRVTGDHSAFGFWLADGRRQDGRPVHHGPESGGRRA